jgi:hypothetical protein
MMRIGFYPLLATAAVMTLMVAGEPAAAQARPSQLAQSESEIHPGPSKDELAGLGCLAAGSAAVVAVGAVGMATIAATGGVAASYANVAMPILGTAFAAGCGVGVLAAPGAAWLFDHYVLGLHRETN